MTTRSWADFVAAEPAFAEAVQKRFGRYKHHVLATVRKDGSPRVTGLEAEFRFGELWLGMMSGSRKAQDLQRDPRFALHANPGPDDSMDGGDVRIAGRAVEVTDSEAKARFTAEAGPPEPYHLFRVEIGEVVQTYVDGDELVVRSWRQGAGVREHRRR